MRKIDSYTSEIQRLYDIDHKITASQVVEAANNATSPLHSYFDWDDESAAHEHRLNQSRRLLKIVLIRETPKSKPERLFNIKNEDMPDTSEGQYKTVTAVQWSPSTYQEALNNVMRNINGLERSLDELKLETVDKPQFTFINLAFEGLRNSRLAIEKIKTINN